MSKRIKLFGRRTISILLTACLLPMAGACSGGAKEPADTASVETASDPANESSGAADETAAQTETPASGEPSADASQTSTADTSDEGGQDDKSAGGTALIPELYVLEREQNYFGEDYSGLKIACHFEQLAPGEETKALYPELTNRLMVINDIIATEEANTYMAAMDTMEARKDEGELDHPYEDVKWEILVRRADEDLLSFLLTTTTASYEDYNYVRYTGYNIDPKTGKDIELTDLVEDRDALLDMLTDKFMTVIKEDMSDFYPAGSGVDRNQQKENLGNYFDNGEMNWTIDPQGVSFWLGSMTLGPVSAHCKILFSEDTDGKIFKSAWRDNIPETWVTEFRMYNKELFDNEDDGEGDTLYIMDKTEYYEESDYTCVSGVRVDMNGWEFEFEQDDPYDIGCSIVHMNGKSLLFMHYQEYDYSFMDLFELSRDKVAKTDALGGNMTAETDEYDLDDMYVIPRRVLTDPLLLELGIQTDLLSTCYAYGEYRITDDGEFKTLSDRHVFRDYAQFELTLKVPLKGVPVVDKETGMPTGETVDLEEGEKIKMKYTDTKKTVDCLTKKNKLIRIELANDEENWGRMIVDGENMSIWDVFDGMMFAG